MATDAQDAARYRLIREECEEWLDWYQSKDALDALLDDQLKKRSCTHQWEPYKVRRQEWHPSYVVVRCDLCGCFDRFEGKPSVGSGDVTGFQST